MNSTRDEWSFFVALEGRVEVSEKRDNSATTLKAAI